MAEPPIIEIREPGRPIRRVVVDRALEVGRECEGEVLADDGVSRRHLKFLPSPLGLAVVDLGSRNGTVLNGIPLEGQRSVEPGDLIRLGRTEIVVAAPTIRPRNAPAPRATILASPATAPLPLPPASPPVVVAPSRSAALLRRILTGADAVPGQPAFRNYLELPRPIPLPVWHAVRALSIAAYVGLCVAMFVRPAGALFAFFGVIVPLLPILFFVAPGLWQNICPLAAANQTPRVLGFSRALTPPGRVRRRGYLVAIVLFFGIAGARLALFNTNANTTGILLSVTIVNAFLAGAAFKGKSGWCSSICPLLPLQRVYGQTPFLAVANTHCNPCVACTKNCYDFKPQVAQQADLHDPDPQWSAPRKLFASALPGFVLGFFEVVGHTDLTRLHMYERLGLYMLGSVGGFYAVEALLGLSAAMVTALWGSAAINIFYWYAGVVLAKSLGTVLGTEVAWARWPIRIVVAVLTVVWISRTRAAERRFLVESGAAPQLIKLTPGPSQVLQAETTADDVEVHFQPDGKAVAAEVGMSVLEVAERDGRPIEAGCRMGVCGADPIAVLAGSECLSAPEEEELQTLRRLGLAPSTRMACCARIEKGSVRG